MSNSTDRMQIKDFQELGIESSQKWLLNGYDKFLWSDNVLKLEKLVVQ
jgi:hypothetical protein